MAEATLSVNGRHVKNLPGRKTDLLTAAWLAQLAECGLLRGSLVPPPVIAELRGLARYGKKLVEDRNKKARRVQRILADMALTRMRPRIPDLRLALVGRFGTHHAVMLKAHLSPIDYLEAPDRSARRRGGEGYRSFV